MPYGEMAPVLIFEQFPCPRPIRPIGSIGPIGRISPSTSTVGVVRSILERMGIKVAPEGKSQA